MSIRWLGAATLVAALAIGCKNAEEDEFAPTFVPKAVVFEGKIDAKFVGDWHSADGNSRLDLKPDGKAHVESVTTFGANRSVAKYEGEWRASQDDLILRYVDSSKQTTTVKYAAKLSGDKMTLAQSGGRLKTVYARKQAV